MPFEGLPRRDAYALTEQIMAERRAALIEQSAARLMRAPEAIERMAHYLAPRAYLPPPFDIEALIRGMLEAAKVPEGE